MNMVEMVDSSDDINEQIFLLDQAPVTNHRREYVLRDKKKTMKINFSY